MEEPDRNPWEQQEGEPSLWFGRFERYRQLGPKRSLQAVYSAEKGTIPHEKHTDGVWSKAASEGRWKERAQAWDISEIERRREEFELEREEERQIRVATLRALRGKLLEAVNELDPKEAKWPEVIAGLRSVHQDLKSELGEDPIRTDEPLTYERVGTAKDKLFRRFFANASTARDAIGAIESDRN